MPEAQLTEPLDRAAEKGGLEEMFAALEADPQPAAFAQRVYREAIRRGFDTADRQVVIGDGAAWIWNVAGEQFPDAIEIVDIYHAKQHLCDVAKAMQADRRPAQARRHALDRRWGQRHHRPALLHPQRTLRGLLGATSRECRLTLISQ